MTRDRFVQLVERSLATIPQEFVARIENLSFQVEDWASPELLEEAELHDRRDLLGYYHGWPLPERGHDYGNCLPDVISLFQQAIELYAAETGLTVQRVLRETILHELAHYFGFDETEMDRIEALWASDDPP